MQATAAEANRTSRNINQAADGLDQVADGVNQLAGAANQVWSQPFLKGRRSPQACSPFQVSHIHGYM